MIRFNAKKLKVEDPNEGVIFLAIYNGISSDKSVAWKIAHRQLDNLQELLDKVKEFINQEEMMKATKLARREPKKSEDQPRVVDPNPFRKKFSGYNFTPLKANISKVLMEIKRDSGYRRPPRIPGVPPSQNSDKRCEFHEANGHYTEGCIALR